MEKTSINEQESEVKQLNGIPLLLSACSNNELETARTLN